MSVETLLLHFFRWLGNTPVANSINDSEWLFPIIESLHITGLAVLIGTVAIVDFRLLGLVLRNRPAPEVAGDLKGWTLAGLGLMLTTGPLMLSAEPERGYGNPAFEFKMSCLLLALLTHFTIHRRVTRRDQPSETTVAGKIAGALSLALWTGVVLGGRAIAFF
ncbi:MAG TPA: DUF6644 family protein [Bryobacterales bacterium]|jgi:hypothetical protein|nr:DUF6644 family protein [Bryobacterales bacterium]